MLNTGKLAGRTLFITGASRGIGKAIALKAAKDGANIIIAAKTATPHPKLPGTIYTAAKEIEDAGGQCLPCVVDIRDENQVQNAVDSAVKQFGGIDIVVNNASAISLTGTQDTTMKSYDLMMNINTRGTFLVSKCCLPYLKVGKNPHILNNSPPLNMNPAWFAPHVAYTMAKYGMSLCVLGMAEELSKFNIAVNAVWPRTGIATAATEMLGGNEVMKQCRRPEIMADAAYVILTKDCRSFSGNFCIDEEVLKEVGVNDFSNYAWEPDYPLLPDFFLDLPEGKHNILKQFQHQGTQTPATGKETTEAAPADSKVTAVFDSIRSVLNEDIVTKIQTVYVFELQGDGAGRWYLDMKTGSGSVGQGEAPTTVDCTFTLKSEDFFKIFSGKMKPAAAFMTGKMKIKGDMGKAMKLEKMMEKLKAKL